MTALIELVCREHAERDVVGPLITRIDGVWAYCEGRGEGGHRWTHVEPTQRGHIGEVSQVQKRQAS
jgi:hypothetical protein